MASQMATAVRMLAVDAVEKAKSGHPGAPMGMADIAEVVWNRHLNGHVEGPGLAGGWQTGADLLQDRHWNGLPQQGRHARCAATTAATPFAWRHS
jgi:hypothetical protein